MLLWRARLNHNKVPWKRTDDAQAFLITAHELIESEKNKTREHSIENASEVADKQRETESPAAAASGEEKKRGLVHRGGAESFIVYYYTVVV